MSYYFVANYDIADQEMYKQYSQMLGSTLMQYGVKILVADRAPNNIEGESRHSLVIAEFKSEEAALSWYRSPEYQAIVNLRIDSTEGWIRGAPQFVMPTS